MPPGQSPSLGFQIYKKLLAKLFISIYHINKISEQSLQWLVHNSPDNILVVLGTPLGQPKSPRF